MNPRLTSNLALLPIGVLVAVGIFSLVSQVVDRRSVPPAEDWQAAAEYVRGQFEQGDIVRVEPPWADQARIHLHGLPVDIMSKPDEGSLYQYDRLWIVVGFGREDRVRETLPARYEVSEVTHYGKTSVLLVDIPPSDYVRYDILYHVEEAVVAHEFTDRTQTCDLWLGNQWHCGARNQWLWVGKTIMEPEDEPRECLYATPIEGNGVKRITFPAVEMSDAFTGHVGLDMDSVRSERGSVLHFAILIDQREVYNHSFGLEEKGLLPYNIDTSDQKGQRVDITFTLRAEDLFDRFLCITGRVVDVH